MVDLFVSHQLDSQYICIYVVIFALEIARLVAYDSTLDFQSMSSFRKLLLQ